MFITLYAVGAWASLNQTQVSQLYVAAFGRASEGEGNAYWGRTQSNLADAANAMLATSAAKSYFGTSLNSNQAFIEHIYANTLNKTRADDPAGITYWVGKLNGGVSRGDVVSSMIATINNFAPGGPFYDPADAKATAAYNQFVNRVTVSNRMADTVQAPPTGWETVTSFGVGLIVTDDMATVSEATQAIALMAGTSSGLASDVEYYMGMITSAGELTPMLTEVSTLLGEILAGESSVVTIEPAGVLDNLNIAALPPYIRITANFGSGYTPVDSTSVYTGLAVINITNIAFAETGITADMALTATNVNRDGQLVLNGGMTLGINAAVSGADIPLTISMTFSNLQSLDSQLNGGLSLTMAISQDLTLSQPVVLTLNQLTTQDAQMSGTVTVTPVSADIYDTVLNLATSEGNIAGTLRLAGLTGDQIILSTPGAPLTAGEYTLDVNNVIIDQTVCPESAASGNIVITGAAETSTLTFNNCTYNIN